MVKNEYLFNISLLQITDVEIARVIRTRKVLTFFFSLVFTTFRFLRHSKYETKKRKNFSTEKNEKGKNKQPHPFEKWNFIELGISIQTLPESDDSTGFNGTPKSWLVAMKISKSTWILDWPKKDLTMWVLVQRLFLSRHQNQRHSRPPYLHCFDGLNSRPTNSSGCWCLSSPQSMLVWFGPCHWPCYVVPYVVCGNLLSRHSSGETTLKSISYRYWLVFLASLGLWRENSRQVD